MHKRDLVASLVTSAKQALHSLNHHNKTVSVKIRIHKDLRETVDFVRTVQDAGVDFITIHGRMRSTPSSQPVNLEAIKLVAEHCSVPTICNGDVFSLEDVEFLKQLGMPAIKIASFELTDLPLIRKAASTGLPMIISTGMGSREEIIDAVIDLETRFARAKPVSFRIGNMPGRNAFVFCAVVRPSKSGTAPGLKRHAEMFLIPNGESFMIPLAFEKDPTDSSYFCHSVTLLSVVLVQQTELSIFCSMV